MEPIRILQVVTIMNRGGLETMLMNYYRKIDRTKIQFDFMVHRNEEGHYDREILSMGGKIYRMPAIRPGRYKHYFQSLNQFFNEYKEYQVVHSHINENSSFVLRAAQKAGIPCRIAHSHLSDLGVDFKLPFRLYARRTMKNHPTNYFACSKKAGKWLFGNRSSITVLNNAVNVEDFSFDQKIRDKIRKEYELENKLVIGHVGRFNKQKNHEFLIKLFKEVHKKEPNSVLILVGDGHLLPKIKKKVAEYNLDASVLFLGVREDIPQLMQAFDLFLFPSLFEGLPVVLVEAQAAGLKCIVSDAITRESDVTGRVEFIRLNAQINEWVNAILHSSLEHVDTKHMLRQSGYDSISMVDWLTGYYIGHSTATSGGKLT